MGDITRITTEEECAAAWLALPKVLRHESFAWWRALHQKARRNGWKLPRRRPAQRSDDTREEWLAKWDALPVPMDREHTPEYQRLRRVAIRRGWELPRRPNAGQDPDRPRDRFGRLLPL